MREIKFRAWNGKEMKPVSSINFDDDGSALTITFETAPRGKYYKPFVHGEYGHLMQFTGEKDEDAKEIYEGDIVDQMGLITEVKFRYGCFFFCSKTDDGQIMNSGAGDFHHIIKQYKERKLKPFSRMKVIGNIYQNPELIKTKYCESKKIQIQKG